MKLKNLLVLLGLVLLSLSAGFLGSVFTVSNIPTWYAALNKPFFTPPNYLFAPVWTFLYFSMGVAAWLVWLKREKEPQSGGALKLFFAQLALNAVWTPLFFGLHWLLAAYIEIVLLWLFILWTIMKFWRISKTAGLLLIPYIIWVSYASCLNLAIWWLNR
ncbi:MAG: tryptophan-rich sensory protein [Candidatus Saganbacteria bacterium]|nr:tryptophan-rich sensory protein [Candidatus Saganbacteria bacterium]